MITTGNSIAGAWIKPSSGAAAGRWSSSSRDTDLVPVLDEVHDLHAQDAERYARIETVAWFNRDARAEGARTFGNLRPTSPRRIWNTNLDRACYEASLDRNDYR